MQIERGWLIVSQSGSPLFLIRFRAVHWVVVLLMLPYRAYLFERPSI